jgi:two-component system nitrogen regulation response regulator GlnG
VRLDEVGLVPEILGQAPAMQEVFRAIGRLSQSTATVMITGESGSGKELVARAVHRHSRALGQVIHRDQYGSDSQAICWSRSFSGTSVARLQVPLRSVEGRFEQAEGGTLFLDEIGDMPAELQTRSVACSFRRKLLSCRWTLPIKANVRIIAATHQNLETRVKEGLFREDLFHRLNVIRVRLPSLRERREDIPILARHFLQKSAQDLGVEAKRFSEGALRHLAALDFPGNVRQLENTSVTG